MGLRLITPPVVQPVSLEETKRHLRIDFDDSDDLISLYILAATQHCEQYTGRAFVDQTWELTIDSFPTNEIRLTKPPLIEVVSIKYDDTNGDEQTLDPTEYTVDASGEFGWVVPNDTWPTPFDGINAVRIQYRAGYAESADSPTVDSIPSDIKAAILLYVGTFYAHRETVVVGQAATNLPFASLQLLRRRRVHTGMA
jgi:uncharacterized phiE125 gp8 family phage protein